MPLLFSTQDVSKHIAVFTRVSGRDDWWEVDLLSGDHDLRIPFDMLEFGGFVPASLSKIPVN